MATVIHLPPREWERVVKAVRDVEGLVADFTELFKGQPGLENIHRLILRLIGGLLTAESATLPAKVRELMDTLAELATPEGVATDEAKEKLENLTEALEGVKKRIVEMEIEHGALKTRATELEKEQVDAERELGSLKRHADTSEAARRAAEEMVVRLTTERDMLKTRSTKLEEEMSTAERDRKKFQARIAELEARDRLLSQVETLLRSVQTTPQPPSTPIHFVSDVVQELERRKTHFVALSSAGEAAMEQDDELAEAIEQCRSEQDAASGERRTALQTQLQGLLRRKERLEAHLTALATERDQQGKAIQALEKFLEAHRRVTEGPPSGLIGVELPSVPELDDETDLAIKPGEPVGNQKVYDEERFRRLEALAARIGLKPEALLLITLYEIVPLRPNPWAEGGIRAILGVKRIVRVAGAIGILQIFGWTADDIRRQWDTGDEAQENRCKELLKYSGSVGGIPGKAYLTFRRTKKLLPWKPEEVLAPNEIASFQKAILVKPERTEA